MDDKVVGCKVFGKIISGCDLYYWGAAPNPVATACYCTGFRNGLR